MTQLHDQYLCVACIIHYVMHLSSLAYPLTTRMINRDHINTQCFPPPNHQHYHCWAQSVVSWSCPPSPPGPNDECDGLEIYRLCIQSLHYYLKLDDHQRHKEAGE
jgi:hypothetical protein